MQKNNTELDRLKIKKKGQIYVYKGNLSRPGYTLKKLDSCVGVLVC